MPIHEVVHKDNHLYIYEKRCIDDAYSNDIDYKAQSEEEARQLIEQFFGSDIEHRMSRLKI